MKKKRKLLPISRLKKKAWTYFSAYIRRAAADSNGMISCVTCKTKVFWKDANASHFIHGHGKSTFLEETNVHPSCIRCNLYLSGNLIEYYAFMVKTYGQDKVDELRAAAKQVVKLNRDYFDGIIEKYKALSDGLTK